MKKVLVTGGAGYLGSHVVEQLLENDYKVIILDNLTFGDNALKKLRKKFRFEFLNGDIRDMRLILKSMEGVDTIIHLAGIVGEPASKIDPKNSVEINYISTKLIVEMAKYFKIKNFIFASTCSVYSSSKNKKLTENSRLNSSSIYAITKIKSEKIILNAKGKNFNPIIFRMGTLFGYSNRMRFDLVINLFTGQAAIEGRISIEGGNQWRPFVHVKDAAGGYIIGVEKQRNSGIFNLGSDDQNYQINQVGEIVKKKFPQVKVETTDVIDRRNYRVNFSKIKNQFKFQPNLEVSDGILEIKNAIKSRKIKFWKDPIYYNNRFPLVGKNKNSGYYWK